jgi:endonuclease-3 related protein
VSSRTLIAYEAALRAHPAFPPQLDRWWPGRTRLEIVVSAMLAQNTSWANAARAMAALRAAGCLTLPGLESLGEAELGRLIRSSGCWRQKARRLRALLLWLRAEHGGSFDRLFRQPTAIVRRQLLEREGIGEETADAILLFAGRHPSFVIDAYTRRIFARHRLPLDRAWIASELEPSARRYRHWHAWMVETAKHYCRKRQPECAACPLRPLLPASSPA